MIAFMWSNLLVCKLHHTKGQFSRQCFYETKQMCLDFAVTHPDKSLFNMSLRS